MKERAGMPYDVVAYEADELAMQLTEAEEGVFHRLLRRAWMNGSLPDDPGALATICRIHKTRFMKYWPQLQKLWKPHPSLPGRLINSKQESERAHVVKVREQNRENIEKRWNHRKNKGNGDTDVLRNQYEGNTSHPNPILTLTNLEVEEETATPELLFRTWNENRGLLPECRKLTEERRKHCRARLAAGNAYLQEFRSAIAKAQSVPFLTGGGNRQWFMTFDWLIANSTNVVKVLEGKYDRSQLSRAEQQTRERNQAVSGFLRDLDEDPGGGLQDA